ncbi:hypothetical protein KJ969_01165 [Patescibacteria group bacterium]|nr:hypothetical protein [Patescibacteria group bacterium]MBU1922251.1 hypothetical protein [Patescibacteria group bacterium]
MYAKDNKGTVLLLALLLMASIVITGVGMGHIIISELQQSILIDNSIIAYYSAESAIESALYQIRALDTPLADLAADGSLENGAAWQLEWSSARPDITVNISQDKTYQLDLFDPDDLSWQPGIEALRFAWEGPGNLEVAYIGWEPKPAIAWPEQDYEVVTPPIAPPSIVYGALNSFMAYRIRLKAVDGDIDDLNITAWSTDVAPPPPGTQVDLPTHITLEATGAFGKARQALSASVPRFNQLSGIFDFVLFSEEEIAKE